MNRQHYKAAVISTEIAISIGLAIVVLFVVLGLFSENLSSLSTSTNFANIFSGGSSKMEYSSYNRNYARSQIMAQIIGTQGLEMLRRKANNKAIELIEESFSSSNSNANSIAYLSTAIKIITGENHICAFMKEDSDRHCDELTEGYNYKLNVSGSALLMKKVDKTGINTEDTVSLPIDSVTSAVLSSVSVPVNEKGYPTEQVDKYALIIDISDKIKNQIRSDVLLMKKSEAFISDSNNAKYKAKKNFIGSALNNIINSATVAFNGCNTDKTAIPGQNQAYCYSNNKITQDDIARINRWANGLTEELASAQSTTQFGYIFNNSLNQTSGYNQSNIIVILQKDTYNTPENQACYVLKRKAEEINAHYEGSHISHPACTPNTVGGVYPPNGSN